MLLKRGANIHVWNDISLHEAVTKGHMNTAGLLLDHGANAVSGLWENDHTIDNIDRVIDWLRRSGRGSIALLLQDAVTAPIKA